MDMSSIYYNTVSNQFVSSDCSDCVQVLNESEKVSLSKAMSYSLRHDESVSLNSSGWISLEQLLNEVSDSISRSVTEQMIRGVVALSDKERFEVKNGHIRALYGHSVNVSIEGTEPEFDPKMTLYHGTPLSNLDSILANGLLPKGRGKVHLTSDIETAFETGQRHATSEPIVIISVEPSDLDATVKNPSGSTYTVDTVPPKDIITYRQVTSKTDLDL